MCWFGYQVCIRTDDDWSEDWDDDASDLVTTASLGRDPHESFSAKTFGHEIAHDLAIELACEISHTFPSTMPRIRVQAVEWCSGSWVEDEHLLLDLPYGLDF